MGHQIIVFLQTVNFKKEKFLLLFFIKENFLFLFFYKKISLFFFPFIKNIQNFRKFFQKKHELKRKSHFLLFSF